MWEYTLNHLKAKKKLALLYVIHSEGSSPGRQGFSMTVNEKGELFGSIGGGFMEHKLVELVKSLMNAKTDQRPFIKKQIHRKDAKAEQSGMICSGEQTVAFYFLDSSHINLVNGIIQCIRNNTVGVLMLNEKGIEFYDREMMDEHFYCSIELGTKWTFRQQIGRSYSVYVVGGGHVGLALSQTMAQIGFYVELLDNREGLNTVVKNRYANKIQMVDYDRIDEYIPEGDLTYVVLVSFGYITDKVILKKLINRNYKYLGMMGSDEKVKTLFKELEEEGVSKNDLANVRAPIGIPIYSKTPEEIAISIAAEIIKVKNIQ